MHRLAWILFFSVACDATTPALPNADDGVSLSNEIDDGSDYESIDLQARWAGRCTHQNPENYDAEYWDISFTITPDFNVVGGNLTTDYSSGGASFEGSVLAWGGSQMEMEGEVEWPNGTPGGDIVGDFQGGGSQMTGTLFWDYFYLNCTLSH